MKQKSRTFKLGVKVASILCCVALLSVGFAAWWIVKINNEGGTTNGSFTTYTVNAKNVTVTADAVTTTATGAGNENKIVFGAPASPIASTWLIADDVATEALTATVTFEVKVDDAAVNLSSLVDSVTLDFAPNTASKTNFDKAINEGYITAPYIESLTYDGSDKDGTVTLTEGEKTYTSANGLTVELDDANLLANDTVKVTATIKFGWGTKCGSTNPYNYYNGQTYSATLANAAEDVLTKVNTYLATAGYDVVIEANAKSAS